MKLLWKETHDGYGGKPHVHRYFLIARKRLQVVLHNFLTNDPPDLHDHAWWNVSIVLRGQLIETYLKPTPWGTQAYSKRVLRPGRVVFRRATDLHRLEVRGNVWTLFITGPAVRTAGFDTKWGWRPWDKYTPS